MRIRSFATLGALSLLAGCGGGNGNGSAGGAPAVNMAITSANAVEASRVSYEAAQSSAGLGTLSSDTGLTAASIDGVAKLGAGINSAANGAGNSAQVPIPPTTTPCAGGGTTTISADIADIVTFNLTTGDTFAIDFSMCNDGAGTTIDGSLDYVVDAFSGSFLGGLYDLTMTMSIGNLQATTVDDVVTMNGGATARLDTLLTPLVAAEVSGTSLTVDTSTSTATQSDFAATQTVDAGAPQIPFTMTASGTLDSSQLSGVVQYSTPVMFEGFGSDYPHSGELLVTGDNSSARLIAIDNVNVRIEVDSDGDGVVDDTINTTWAALTGS